MQETILKNGRQYRSHPVDADSDPDLDLMRFRTLILFDAGPGSQNDADPDPDPHHCYAYMPKLYFFNKEKSTHLCHPFFLTFSFCYSILLTATCSALGGCRTRICSGR
jgi:hypothetical protein